MSALARVIYGTGVVTVEEGTVTTVSVVSANGFAGSVATASTTPAITIQTSITGILQGNGTAISAASTTGSGNVVLATSPTLTTPVLGAATATSLNGLTITSSTGVLSITNAKTLAASNTLTLAGTDGSTLNVGAGGTLGSNAFTSTAYLPLAGGTLTGPARSPNYAVASLPSASTSGAGAVAFVTDSNATIAAGLGNAVVGGGSNKVPVYSDGTNWIIG